MKRDFFLFSFYVLKVALKLKKGTSIERPIGTFVFGWKENTKRKVGSLAFSTGKTKEMDVDEGGLREVI